jgi:IS30 family transposase
MSVKQIADDLRVHRSTVYHELRRNSDGLGRYDAEVAHRRASERRSRASRIPRKIPPDFIDAFVYRRLENGHGPHVIANTLAPSAPSISTRWLYELIDRAHRHGDPDLASLLRRKYKRKSPLKQPSEAGVHLIPKRVDIAQRPPEVDTRETFGHWEADTVIGSHHQGALVTVVERKTRQLVSRAVAYRTKTAVADAIIEALGDIAHGVQSITFDNGGEFADHARIADKLGCKTYFARPYRSCDRGTNDHVNGQLRQYYPKGRSLRGVNPFYLQVNVEHLNRIPREILQFVSPQRLFEQELGALKTPPPG